MKQPVKATILVFCSGPVMRHVLQDVLESDGYVVQTAGELGEAVDRLRQSKPDLLLVRPYVENISGHDAARYLRTMAHGLAVLIVGGTLDDDRLRYRESLLEFDVFPKPFTAAELLDKVREVLRKSAGTADS